MRWIVLVITFTATSAAAESVCEQALRLEAHVNPTLPKMVDEMTELFQFSVNCERELVTYKRRLIADPNELSDGWLERMQRQHTQLHCNKVGLASTSKWSAQDILYGPDLEYLGTVSTRPDDCNDGKSGT